jgi:hypothetical protein
MSSIIDTSMCMIEKGDENESSMLELATEIWHQLEKHYPNHPWLVAFQGGAMIVRHSVINASVAAALGRDGFGFLMPKDKLGTHKEVVKSAIDAGGAMLELFGYRRGAWDGSEPTIPTDWKHKQETAFA